MNVSLTLRDRALLSKLSSYGVLSSRQMESLLFPGICSSTALRRLRKLKRAGLIERVTGLPCGEHAWHVTRAGAATVGDSDSIATVSKNTLEHAVRLSDTRMTLENHQAAHGWIPEHELKRQWGIQEKRKNHEFTVVPDGMFAAIVRGESRIISLELELHAKGRRMYRKLFDQYPRHVPIWKVWYVVSDPKIAKVVLEIWKEVCDRGQEDWIVWSKLSDMQTNLSEARVYSLLGSLPISKWITVQSISDLGKCRPNPAQTAAHAQSSERENKILLKIENHQAEEELSSDPKILNLPPPGQHCGEYEGVDTDFSPLVPERER
jgi:hypothetical protein